MKRGGATGWACAGLACAVVAACGHGDSARTQETAAPSAAATVERAAVSAAPSAAPSVAPRASARVVTGPRPAAPKMPCFDEGSTAGDWLPRGSTMDAGFEGAAVDALIRDAMTAQSDAILVVKDGVVVIERSFHGVTDPIETRSATKSVVGLAILALVADGRIPSLDAPLSTWYPEFGNAEKAKITLRHVLTHSSGLSHGDDADALNAAPDRLAYVRALRVIATPGVNFSYSNEATQLLLGIIESASGQEAEAFVRARLLEPIGVRDLTWARDRSGKVQMYYGLKMRARDLARIGLLLLGEGRAGDARILPAELVREATKPQGPNPYFGLLHWLLYRGTTTRLGYLEPPKGPQIGYFAVGGLGQRYAVWPEARIVAVRLHRRRGDGKPYEDQVTWRGFFDRVEALDPILSGRTAAR